MLAVIKKELKSYLLSPIGYIFIGLFLIMFSILFYNSIFAAGVAYFEYAFYDASTIMTFLIPVLTMRMFSEERKNGTEQLLLTSPRSLVSIVLGKFLAAMIIVLITVLGTLMHFFVLKHFGSPDIRVALCTMFGFFLLCGAYVSFGMFASSITENQIVASVLTIGVFILMWFLPGVSQEFYKFSLMYMFDHFPQGVIALNEVVRFVSFSILFILLTIIVLQRRKSVK
ncbi:MAG: ABC transporter permease subunit [Clostridia bacterium]|nr:ABC transporter permease subunit [Clostridia bacterium]